MILAWVGDSERPMNPLSLSGNLLFYASRLVLLHMKCGSLALCGAAKGAISYEGVG